MSVAILIFLLLNFVLLGAIALGLFMMAKESSDKKIKRIGVLEHEKQHLASSREACLKEMSEYKKKYPLKAKYNIGQTVVAIQGVKVCKGIIHAVTIFDKGVIVYQIKLINHQDENSSSVIEVFEEGVYEEKALKL